MMVRCLDEILGVLINKNMSKNGIGITSIIKCKK